MKKIRVMEMIDRPFLGGGQMTVLFLAENIDKEKFEVSVCSAAGGALDGEVQRLGLAHFAVPFSKKIRGETVKEICSLLSDKGIDILHTHGGIAGFYGRWAARKAGTPVVIHTLHGIHYLHYRNPLLRRLYVSLESYFSRFTDSLIVVSDADRRKALEFRLAPSSKIVLIRNGMNFAKFANLKEPGKKKKELGLEPDQPVIGTVARLHRQKGIIYFLKAAIQIHQVYPRAMVLIAGGGPLKRQLEKRARALGVDGQVLFLGERTDVPGLLSLFDVFVLPSLWEGLPYALIEAAALARPTVATDIDGVREVVHDGETGLLVPPKNPEKLAEAIIRLLGNKELASRLGGRAKEFIPPQYTLSRLVEETQGLYTRIKQAKSIKFL